MLIRHKLLHDKIKWSGRTQNTKKHKRWGENSYYGIKSGSYWSNIDV